MQKDVERAGNWYIKQTGADVDKLRRDLQLTLKHRDHALRHGDLEEIYKTFAYVEIIKAAIHIANEQDYETEFSKTALSYIRKYSEQQPKLYTCNMCGQEYPATAFLINLENGCQSKFCIRCDREIKELIQRSQKPINGKIAHNGAIICSL